MQRLIPVIFIFITTIAHAGVVGNAAGTTAGYNYNYMYPYLNNQMRTALNPGVTPSQSSNPINTVTRTENLSTPRRVVARGSQSSSASTGARAATNTATTNTGTTTAARAATGATNTSGTTSARRVVARGTTRTNRAATVGTTTNNTVAVSSSRCLADYTQCMNEYCVRENTAYNRCYCSAKLAQIDAKYQPEIDRLIKQILTLQSDNSWSDIELNQYWASTIGKYTNDNSWTNIDDALNINWADLESRVRGANAFSTGHEYCMRNLNACAYMASNLRDAYRSDVARDCATYENGLMKIKNAAESLVESYND